MDDETRRLLQEAYALGDAAKADYERYQREHLQQQSVPAQLVHKTYTPRPAPQQQTVMDPQVQAGWDKWVRAHLKIAIDGYDDALNKDLTATMGKVISRMRHEMREHVAGEIKKQLDAEATKLREEIAGLRIDTVVGRSVLRGEINALMKTKTKVRT